MRLSSTVNAQEWDKEFQKVMAVLNNSPQVYRKSKVLADHYDNPITNYIHLSEGELDEITEGADIMLYAISKVVGAIHKCAPHEGEAILHAFIGAIEEGETPFMSSVLAINKHLKVNPEAKELKDCDLPWILGNPEEAGRYLIKTKGGYSACLEYNPTDGWHKNGEDLFHWNDTVIGYMSLPK